MEEEALVCGGGERQGSRNGSSSLSVSFGVTAMRCRSWASTEEYSLSMTGERELHLDFNLKGGLFFKKKIIVFLVLHVLFFVLKE